MFHKSLVGGIGSLWPLANKTRQGQIDLINLFQSWDNRECFLVYSLCLNGLHILVSQHKSFIIRRALENNVVNLLYIRSPIRSNLFSVHFISLLQRTLGIEMELY